MERVPNIGGRALYQRLLLGIIGVLAAYGVYWLQTSTGSARELRLLAFIPLLVAMYGFFQFREKTCVRLAAEGRCDMGTGVAPLDDPFALHHVRRQARVVHASAIVSAAAITAVLYVI